MFKVERDDINRSIKLIHNGAIKYINTSHKTEPQDLVNLLQQVYEWGQEDNYIPDVPTPDPVIPVYSPRVFVDIPDVTGVA